MLKVGTPVRLNATLVDLRGVGIGEDDCRDMIARLLERVYYVCDMRGFFMRDFVHLSLTLQQAEEGRWYHYVRSDNVHPVTEVRRRRYAG